MQKLLDVIATIRFVGWELVLWGGGRIRSMNRLLLAGLALCVFVLVAVRVAAVWFHRQPDAWRESLPNEEQLQYANALGVHVRDGVTKGELADEIKRTKELRRDVD